MGEGLMVQNVLSKSSVPFYPLLVPYYKKWVPAFLVSQEKRPQLQELEKQRLQLNNEPMPLDQFLAQLRGHFSSLNERRHALLTEHLQNFRSPATSERNPFDVESFTGPMGKLSDAFFPFSWAEIERAVKAMPEGLSDKDRRKLGEKLDRQIAELRAELDASDLPGRYMMSKARILADSWSVFVAAWVSLQGKLVAPCGPRGLVLGMDGGADETWAHEQLGLADHVNKRGRFTPNPGSGDDRSDEHP